MPALCWCWCVVFPAPFRFLLFLLRFITAAQARGAAGGKTRIKRLGISGAGLVRGRNNLFLGELFFAGIGISDATAAFGVHVCLVGVD